MAFIHHGGTRTVTTAGGIMTTLASPTVGGASRVSVWSVQMAAGQAGPLHVIDREQVWTLLEGRAELTIEAETATLKVGEGAIVPGGASRQVRAVDPSVFIVVGAPDSLATLPGSMEAGVTPPWVR